MNNILNSLSDYIGRNNYLAFSLIYIISGLLVVIYNKSLFSKLVSIILLIMLLTCIRDLLNFIVNKKKSKLNILKTIFNLIIVIISLWFIDVPQAILVMIFSAYLVSNGIIKLFSYILLKLDKIKGGASDLIEGIIYSLFGIICFFSPKINMDKILYVIGFYLIFLGISYLFDYLDQKNIHIRRIRIPLPTIVDALIPFSVMQKINHLVDRKKVELDLNKCNEEVDLEIFVHVSNIGMGKLGHVDLCYKGQIISYGNYDMDSRKLREGIGSGVVFTSPKNEYIKFCVEYSKKTLFGFGIKLNKRQENKVEKELDKIFSDLTPWNPRYVRALNIGEKIKESDYQDYASMLYKNTKANFYKFKTSKLKTYFVLGNNCGTLVDKILKSSGAEVLKMYGIITPGTYYDFLEREYMKKGSNVVSKKIYDSKNIDELGK